MVDSVRSPRVRRFPNQYCAATPSLQYSDDKTTWTTKLQLDCSAECPNNATGSEPQKGWTVSPGPGTVAPRSVGAGAIGAIVDYFSFRSVA